MLSPGDRSFLRACCWGDGTISKLGFLHLRHSAKQERYLEWKALEASRILDCPFFLRPYESKCQGRSYPAVEWYSAVNDELKQIRSMLYATGVKRITSDFLSGINKLGLAVLYMDDGSLHLRKRGVSKTEAPYIRERIVELALYASYDEVLLIRDWIEGLTGALMSPREPMRKLSPGKFNLRCNGTQARRFVQSIENFEVPCMRYKFDLQYDTRTNRGKSCWSEADLRKHVEADKGTRVRDTLAA